MKKINEYVIKGMCIDCGSINRFTDQGICKKCNIKKTNEDKK